MKRQLPFAVAIIAALALVTSCSSVAPPAASVNSTEISRSEFQRDLDALAGNKQLVKYYKGQGLELVPSGGGFDSASGAAWLSSIVSQVIVDKAFSDRDLKVTKADVAAAKKELAESQTFGGPKVFAKFPKWFQTELAERQARASALGASLPKPEAPPEAELRTLFDEQGAAFCPSGKIVGHVLVETSEEASAVKTALADGGDFAAIAKEKSIDKGSGAQDGLLTCIDSQDWGKYDQAFRDAAVATEVGTISEPVKTQFGYHLITVKDFTFENARPFLEAVVARQTENPVSVLVNSKLDKAKLKVDPRFGRVVRDAKGTRIDPPKKSETRRKPTTPSTTPDSKAPQGGTTQTT
ncbi:MAG: hypothetical protein EXQ69_02395 [Acidimicrobiia bacterium]|nr:hypothetical protein [Acidimicrobiia bacterium]